MGRLVLRGVLREVQLQRTLVNLTLLPSPALLPAPLCLQIRSGVLSYPHLLSAFGLPLIELLEVVPIHLPILFVLAFAIQVYVKTAETTLPALVVLLSGVPHLF